MIKFECGLKDIDTSAKTWAYIEHTELKFRKRG